ncbi:sensor histidine kinase [Actinomycetospora termitidis]|uniref:Histidine kinase n=1 Tax=Actinomycetospora termitidis TaxID=3053470 RepID=A0ABT7M4B9_9PSEU|nr:histidine kinase [Actinomycetospora sp. Odt1-22]MDL5155530.1 histidine kinase [Actinomycetospora sp. Odt1-22]
MTSTREPAPGVLVLAVLAAALLTTAAAGVGPLRDADTTRATVAGTVLLGVLAAQGWALLASLHDRSRRWPVVATAVATAASVPLLAPSGVAQGWETWAWVAAGIAGSSPVVLGWRAGAAVAVVLVAGSAAVGWRLADDGALYAVLTAGSAAGLLLVHLLPWWLWTLVVQARAGRAAAGALAAADERLRFASEVHDVLGHHLTVIAVAAELAARTAHDDPDAATEHAERARALAATALQETRRLAHGHRDVDLGHQLDAVAEVLRASGVRCTVHVDDAVPELSPAARTALAAVVREAGTNVLRHSEARWCTITLVPTPDRLELTVANDGAPTGPADAHGSGLRGLAVRVDGQGGSLTSRTGGGVFTVCASLPLP